MRLAEMGLLLPATDLVVVLVLALLIGSVSSYYDPFYTTPTTCQPQRNVQVLVYNRVPKAGSTSVLERVNASKYMDDGYSLRILPIHTTDNYKETGGRARALHPSWRAGLVDYVFDQAKVATTQTPLFVHGHFLFIDFVEQFAVRPSLNRTDEPEICLLLIIIIC
eukprot:m.189805 g.189805  ORF g.189805 m.189805 type:complete len:165 (+) comp16747_c0_seq23:43-537(+)